MDLKEEVQKRKKDKWIEVWMTFDVLATQKEAADSSLESHIEQLCKAKDVFVFEKSMMESVLVKNPIPKVQEAYSKASSVKAYIKDFTAVVNLIFHYGPSSMEIIQPEKLEIKVDEMQDIANNIAGYIHQYAAAGIGGLVIFPKGKQGQEK